MKYLFLILLTSIFFQINLTFAQTQDLEVNLNDIVIKENRIEIPFSDVSRNIALITKKDIEAINPTNINSLLQQVAGVDVRQRGINGVQADVSIRGGTFEQTLILINGIKMIDPQTGHHLMNLPIQVEDIERIEVLKGQGARIYGQNAFAGAINIVTKVRKKNALFLNAETGSFNTNNYYASATIAQKNTNHHLSFGQNNSDGYRYNTDYAITNLFYQNQTKTIGGKINVLAAYTDRKFGANGFYGNETFTEQYESVQTGFLNISLTQKIKDWKITPKISWRRNIDNWQFLRSDPEVFQNFHTTDVISGELHFSKTHNTGIFGFGIEHQNINIESNNLGDHFRQQFGFHIENRLILNNNKWDITPGIYALYDSDFGVSYYPGIDIGFRYKTNVKFFANAGVTNRLPTYTDLYYSDPGNNGNENLITESAFTTELGAKYSTFKFNVQASIFHRISHNLIDWYKLNLDDKWTPDNFAGAKHKGFDFAFKYNDVGGFVNSLTLNYLYLIADFETSDFTLSRNQLENLKHQFVLSPSFKIHKSLSLNFLYKYNARVSLDNYAVLDANLVLKQKTFDAYLKANNIFDKQYRETNLVPMPGKWFLLGVNVRL